MVLRNLMISLLRRESTLFKILHKLFGWDYIFWENTADTGIARIHQDCDGTIWYWRYKNIKIIDKIKSPKQVLWLTCPSTKYFK
jgi:hypothetical protein